MSALATTAQGGTQAEVADGELVRRVRRGDDGAFEQLYHRYHRRITAYIFGMVHDHGRAEDVAQDVFVSALRRMRDTDRPIAFKPWIYEIAKNACIDQFRRARRAEEVSYDAEEGMGAADYGRLVSSEAMPENELESKQNLAHLRGAFGGLSETHHEILVMRELEGLSYREIGERLGMSRPSVESTLFRARRRLTEEYEELVSGQRCQRIQAIIAGATSAAPGARDQRRLARHVSHCQPCRRQARLAGLDVAVTADRPVRQRIAAMLPLPLFLRRRWSAEATDATGLGTGQAPAFAQWSAQLGATMDPGWLKAAATAATVAVAGAGAGLAGGGASVPVRVGSFAQVLPSFDDGSRGGSRLVAGRDVRVAPVFRTESGVAAPQPGAGSGAATAAATAPAPTGAPSAASGSAAPAVRAEAPGVDAAAGLPGAAQSIVAVAPAAGQPGAAPAAGSAPSSSSGTGTGGGSGQAAPSVGANASAPAATAPSAEVPAASAPAAAPPSSGAPDTGAAAPAPAAGAQDASGSAGSALGAAGLAGG